MPKKIGAVTSLSGAAVRDIINVLTRRYPIGEIYAVNAVVQGEAAADSVCRGILTAEAAGCDVIIVGRGGGSAEDLSAFNSEKIAYAIYNCKVPVISAVGHETDFTIADLAADMRAPTPSAAAELSAPSVDSLYEKYRHIGAACSRRLLRLPWSVPRRDLATFQSEHWRSRPKTGLRLQDSGLKCSASTQKQHSSAVLSERKRSFQGIFPSLRGLVL